jgi:hypothetical protein
VRAREWVQTLNAGDVGRSVQFCIDVVYADGCRMPWW